MTARLVRHMTACSGGCDPDALAQLTRSGETAWVLYEEGKRTLSDGDHATARVLFRMCPPDLANVRYYLTQCNRLDTLCEAVGCTHRVLLESNEDNMERHLAAMLKRDATDGHVLDYARTLRKRGFRANSLDALTLDTVASVTDCMTEGDRILMRAHVRAAAPWLVRFVHDVSDTVSKCITMNRDVGSSLAHNRNMLKAMGVGGDEAAEQASDETEDETAG
jgi:hypothetical protein